MYPIVVQGMGATRRARAARRRARARPRRDARARSTPRTRVVIVCNPNNPTGHERRRRGLRRASSAALPEDVVLVVDEAYGEFALRPDFPDALGWVRRAPGHAACCAPSRRSTASPGLRVGYARRRPRAGRLPRARAPPVQREPARRGGRARGARRPRARGAHAASERRGAASFLDARARRARPRGTWPSDANFLLAAAPAPAPTSALLREGVIVRPMARLRPARPRAHHDRHGARRTSGW